MTSWRDDINYGLAAFGVQLPRTLDLDSMLAKLTDRPATNAFAVVGLSSVVFFLAERGHNPRMHTIWDAMEYCSTSLSVGYSQVFPHTPVGKLLGSILSTIGPAMVNRTLDGRASAAQDDALAEVQLTLLQILKELRLRRDDDS